MLRHCSAARAAQPAQRLAAGRGPRTPRRSGGRWRSRWPRPRPPAAPRPRAATSARSVAVDLGPAEVGHHHAGGQLGDLARHADEHHPLEAGAGRPAQGDAGEVADLDEAHGVSREAAAGRRRPSGCRWPARRCAAPWAAATSICWTTAPGSWPWRTASRCRWCRGSRCRRRCRGGRCDVFAAMASPPGTENVTTSGRSVTSASAARIMRAGTGLMAGAPTGEARGRAW